MGERLPLAVVHSAIMDFLHGRDDAVVFGAIAVNAYITNDPRMTQDVDLQSIRARELSEELRQYLHERFHIAVRVREIGGRGFRVYQVQEPANRHLADVRQVDALPPARRILDVLVIEPPELIAGKVIAHELRRGKPKSGTDWRDLAMMLLAFPELKTEHGPVREALERLHAPHEAFHFWSELVREEIRPEEDDDI